jgi:hypothetical protein
VPTEHPETQLPALHTLPPPQTVPSVARVHAVVLRLGVQVSQPPLAT